MQLENFVNVMGINVIQVIDQIQNDSRTDGEKSREIKKDAVDDTDQYFDKDWYQRRKVNNYRRSRDECLASTKISKCNSSNGSQILSLAEQQLQQQQQQQQPEQLKQQPQQQGFIQTITPPDERNSTEDQIPTTEKHPPTVSQTETILALQPHKTIDKKELILPTTSLCATSLNNQKTSINKQENQHAKNSGIDLAKKSLRLSDIRSRVWKRPNTIRWCTSKEFLSTKHVKTYEDACEAIRCKRDGTVRVNDSKNHRDEFIDIFSTDRIDFIYYHPC